MDDEVHDGIEWLLGYSLQYYIQKAGAPLEERINIFSRCLAYTRSRIIKKRKAPEYDKDKKEWVGDRDVVTIQNLIEYVDGHPCPEGGCTDTGLRSIYNPEFDCPENCNFHYQKRKKIEQQLDYYHADMIEVVDRNNLCSREIMNQVAMQSSSSARVK